MAKEEPKLSVVIPRPGSDAPAWSRVGVIAAVGFVVGIAWPRLTSTKIGPDVPADLAAKMEATAGAAKAAPPPSGAPSAAASASPAPLAKGSAEPDAPVSNRESIVIGPGKIIRCSDRKSKKIEDCGSLPFDPIATKRLKELAKCPAANGLDGKMAMGFEINFDKKEVSVVKSKKGTTTIHASLVSGLLACAAREFGNVPLDEVAHKHRKYTLVYALTFYPPGKRPPGNEGADSADEGAEGAAGSTSDQTDAAGDAVVTWDTALVRKDPKEVDVVMRLVRGTKVKILGKQGDHYRIEANGKTGWVYRGAIGK